MASSLRSIVDASERLRLSQGGVIAREDSAAAKEYEGADSDQLERALSESHQQGLKALVAGFDLAAGAAELAGRPDRAFSVMSLLRSSTEAAANSFWYLDPTIEPSLRESRAIGGVRVAVGAARRFGRTRRIFFLLLSFLQQDTSDGRTANGYQRWLSTLMHSKTRSTRFERSARHTGKPRPTTSQEAWSVGKGLSKSLTITGLATAMRLSSWKTTDTLTVVNGSWVERRLLQGRGAMIEHLKPKGPYKGGDPGDQIRQACTPAISGDAR